MTETRIDPELEEFAGQIADQVESFLVALQALVHDEDSGRAISLLLLEVSQVLLAGARLGAQADFTPRDRRLQGHLEQVQRELNDPQADHRASLESLQQLIDQAEDVFTDATMGQSVRERVFGLLAKLPEPTAKLYEETFGPAARAILQSAELDPDQARLGFTADFSSTMHSLSPTLLRTLRQMGMPEAYIPVMQEIWRKPAPMHVRNQEFEDFLTAENFDFARLGPFTRLAFNMHGLVPPEEWLDIMPQIFHVHAKFYDIDANGDEPAMDIPRIVKQFVDGGYTGYLSSEWEGHAFADLGEADPIDLVKKQHALMRRAIEQEAAARV